MSIPVNKLNLSRIPHTEGKVLISKNYAYEKAIYLWLESIGDKTEFMFVYCWRSPNPQERYDESILPIYAIMQFSHMYKPKE